ncbi:MAG: ABC transporter permease, partial [Bacteroidota bacterium]
MVKNFLLATLRNLRKNTVYSLINICGLAIGIACSILILLWVHDEVSYDTFVPKSERLYQVWVNSEYNNTINSWRSVPLPTYEALKNSHSAITNTTVAGWGGERLLTVGDTRLTPRGYYVGEEFLDMFEYQALQGNADIALDDPSSIVITESLAQKLFGDQEAMGQIIKVSDESNLQVTCVLEDLPGNSSFEFEYLIPWKQREKVNEWVVENKDNWGNYSFQVFVELDQQQKELEVEKAIFPLLKDNGEDDFPVHLWLHPMERWRLHSEFEEGKEAGGRIEYVQLFTIIAIIILAIACINFMNLATARSEKRAREVGIRKSLGSTRLALVSQFIGESVFISFVAFALALILSEIALPFYNDLVDKELSINYLSTIFWVFTTCILLGTGVVSGSYPAVYLSAFDPVRTLKGTIKVGKGASTPRKVLVILQFAVAILLMVGTFIIYQQISLVQARDLGYDQEYLISVDQTEQISEKYNVLKESLLQSGAVEAVTKANGMITNINSNNFLGWPGKPEELKVIFTTVVTEYDYAQTMGIDLLMGRDFSKEFASDSTGIIVNKAALDLMELQEPIIGTNLDLWGEKYNLIGVVDNVLMGSPYREIKPLFMVMGDWGGSLTLRLKKGTPLKESLATVESIFNEYNSAYPFDYVFVDQAFQRKFIEIELTKKLALLFSMLAIFITGLGLFGLASFMAEQRTKEIGIRKVLGASISSLISLISRDFSKLVLISFLIVTPLSWWLLDLYLE